MSEGYHDIPKAFRYEVWFCGHCSNGHIVFFDGEGNPLLDATMSAKQAENLAKLIRENDPNFKGKANV